MKFRRKNRFKIYTLLIHKPANILKLAKANALMINQVFDAGIFALAYQFNSIILISKIISWIFAISDKTLKLPIM